MLGGFEMKTLILTLIKEILLFIVICPFLILGFLYGLVIETPFYCGKRFAEDFALKRFKELGE